MAGLPPIADLSLDQLRSCVTTVEEEIAAGVNMLAKILFVASVLDEDVYQTHQGGKSRKLKSKLVSSKASIQEGDIAAIVQFAYHFCSQPSADLNTSHNQKLIQLMEKVTKWVTNSEEAVIEGGNTRYDQLDTLVSEILNWKGVEINLTKQAARGQGWAGGNLEDYVQFMQEHRSASSFVETVYYSQSNATRLTEEGRSIIRNIMKQARDAHADRKVFGGLSMKNVYLTKDFEIVLPTLRAGDEQSTLMDLRSIKIIIESMVGERSPKDVTHLCSMLNSTWRGLSILNKASFLSVMYNHTCMWSPQETIAYIYIFRMICLLKKGAEVPDRSQTHGRNSSGSPLVDQANKVSNTITKHWQAKLEKEYFSSCAKWMEDIKAADARRSADGVFMENMALLSDAIAILFFKRNCFVHVNEHLAEDEKKTVTQIEGELYVMFPDFLCHFVLQMRDIIDFEAICRI